VPDSAFTWYNQSLLANYHSQRSPRILFVLAELSRTNPEKRFPTPEEYYEKIERDFPESVYAEEARRFLGKATSLKKTDAAEDLYIQAEKQIDEKQYRTAVKTLSVVPQKYPDSPLAVKSTYAAGWVLENFLLQPESAIVRYRNVVQNYKGTYFAQLAVLRLDAVLREDSIRISKAITDSIKTSNAIADSLKTVKAIADSIKAAASARDSIAADTTAHRSPIKPGAGKKDTTHAGSGPIKPSGTVPGKDTLNNIKSPLIDTVKAEGKNERTVQHSCPVVSCNEVAEKTYLLRFRSSEIATLAQAGQFVNVLVAETGEGPLLRRPFSIARIEGKTPELLFHAIGPGTVILSKKKPGDEINVLVHWAERFAWTLILKRLTLSAGELVLHRFPF